MAKYNRDNNDFESRNQQATNKNDREEGKEQSGEAMQEHERSKTAGKVEPLKMSKEELEKRKETGYKTDEEATRTPDIRHNSGHKPKE